MHDLTIVLVLLVVAASLAPLARRLDIPLAIVHVLGGMALAFVPQLRAFQLDPKVAFTLFVPPLLYWAALTTSLRDFRRSARAIGLLATTLVAITVLVVAVVSHSVLSGLAWAPAFVLGAIVAPPDATVVTAVARGLGIPRGLVTVLEGETLMNDTTAFVAYNFAITATVTGTFEAGTAVAHFAWSIAGGVGIGLLAARLVGWLRAVSKHTEVENTISILTSFLAYLPAEHIGASGVLAVVTTGLALSRTGPRFVPASTRIQAIYLWQMLLFSLNGVLFTLLGLRLGDLVGAQVRSFDRGLVLHAFFIAAAVVVTRLVWVFPSAYLPPALSSRVRQRDGWPNWRPVLFAAWSGLRGGDTLVTALAIPLVTASGAPFPFRDTINQVAFGVILLTLVVQGLTLRPLVLALHLPQKDENHEREQLVARRAAARAGRDALIAAAQRDGIEPTDVAKLVAWHELRTGYAGDDRDIDAFLERSRAASSVTKAALDAERAALVQLRDDDQISDEVLRIVQHEIDLEELRVLGDAEQ